MNVATATFSKRTKKIDTNMDLYKYINYASIGTKIIKAINAVKFLTELEESNALIAQEDIGWINELCQRYLHRNYNQPIKKIEVSMPTIKVGTDANDNNLMDNSKKVEIKKVSYWKSQDGKLERIYFDSLIDGTDHHCYLDTRSGKYFEKGGNKVSLSFGILEEHFLNFLKLETKEDLLKFRTVKAA